MARIFVSAVESPADRKAVERSVAAPIDRQLIIRSFSDATYPELIDIERRGHGFYAWGLPGTPQNVENWFQMGIGDFVLLGQRDSFRHYAKVLGRYENARAARAIWGSDDEGDVLREYLFFLSEPIQVSLPYAELADYLPTSVGDFSSVPDEAMERIEADFGSVERFARRRLLQSAAGGPVLDMSGMIRLSEREMARLQMFEPQNSKEGRQGLVDTIIKRRGLPAFRQALLDAYDYRCAITNFNAVDTLEAACIVPFRGKATHSPSNGLLLRSDIHTLFDLGKIGVDTGTMSVVIADDLHETSYRILAGRPLRYPRDENDRPSTEALDLHRRLAGL
ncbi:MAG: HNH endonuclease [Gammaproteobacteria bacterium]|nr:HNH endonuclease [Gammaproteobacteria bacterium]